MPYSDAWGATIQQDSPTPGDVTMTLTDSVLFVDPVTCVATAKTDVGAKEKLSLCFVSQPGPAPRLWWLRYRIARGVATRAKWVSVRAVLPAGNQNRQVTRTDPNTGQDVTQTAAQWVVIMDAKIAQAQAMWDEALAMARAEGTDE